MENSFRRLRSLLSDGYRVFMMNLSMSHEMDVLNEPIGGVIQHISATEVAASLQRMILKYSFFFHNINSHFDIKFLG